MDRYCWKLDELVGREALEEILTLMGGATLERQLEAQRRARESLQQCLLPRQREAWLDCSDAVSEAWTTREVAATSLALTLGVAMGATLTLFPDEPPSAVVRTASRALCAALRAPLSAPERVAGVALSTLDWTPASGHDPEP